MLSVSKMHHYAEWYYAECRYAECHYAECQTHARRYYSEIRIYRHPYTVKSAYNVNFVRCQMTILVHMVLWIYRQSVYTVSFPMSRGCRYKRISL